MARVSQRFVDETLWPEYQQISETLRANLSHVTDRIVGEVLHGDGSEAEVVEQPPQLGFDAAEAPAPESPPAEKPAPPPPESSGPKRKVRKKKRKRR